MKDRTFPRMHELFPARHVEVGSRARPLPQAEPLAARSAATPASRR